MSKAEDVSIEISFLSASSNTKEKMRRFGTVTVSVKFLYCFFLMASLNHVFAR